MDKAIRDAVGVRASAAQAAKRAAVGEVHDLLRPFYEQAKRDLKSIQAETPESRGFVDEVQGELSQLRDYPQDLSRWLQELERNIHLAPTQLQAGIDRFDQITYEQIADDHSQRVFIGEVRLLLRSGDGQISRRKQLRGMIMTCLQEYLAGPGGRPTTVPSVQERVSSKVDSSFEV